MATPKKDPTVTTFNKKEAEKLVERMKEGTEDYDLVVLVFSVSMNAAGLILGYMGTRYLREMARDLEKQVKKMASNDLLVITTTWKYVNHGKNNGFVPNKVEYGITG